MTEDHLSVHAEGARQEGREAVRRGWRRYLFLFADDAIEAEAVVAQGDQTVVGRPRATAVPTARSSERPAAWRARIEGAKVAEWRVYVDMRPAYAALGAEEAG